MNLPKTNVRSTRTPPGLGAALLLLAAFLLVASPSPSVDLPDLHFP